MNGHMEGRGGRKGPLDMLKDTCGAFGGPPHDGQGSASGGSNFSKPWEGQ